MLRFFEKEPTATALRTALAAEFHDRDFEVIAGDCNATIAKTLVEFPRFPGSFRFVDHATWAEAVWWR